MGHSKGDTQLHRPVNDTGPSCQQDDQTESDTVPGKHDERMVGNKAQQRAYRKECAEESSRKASVTEDHKGRLLFAPQLTYNELSRVFAFGGVLKKVVFEEEVEYEDYCEEHSQTQIPLFAYYSTGEVEVCAADGPMTPAPPCDVIS